MAKSKEGRNRKSQTDMSTECGRLMLKDLINYATTGFNPFIPESYKTKKFWESREEYQKASFGAFIAQVEKMATIAIAQMPTLERKKEEQRIEAEKNATDENGKNSNNKKEKRNNAFENIKNGKQSGNLKSENNETIQSL
jgi:septin family protein